MLVFTSQDAVAARRDVARDGSCAPLGGRGRVAGVYGRQLPHDDATPPERYFLDFLYGPDATRPAARRRGRAELRADALLERQLRDPARRLGEFPFADDLIMSEDQEWSRRVLRAGYELVYEPEAAVHHSHRYSVAAAFRRFFDSGVSAERSYAADARGSRRAAPRRRAVRARRGRVALADGAAPLDPVRRRLRAREVRRAAARPAPSSAAAARSSAGSARSSLLLGRERELKHDELLVLENDGAVEPRCEIRNAHRIRDHVAHAEAPGDRWPSGPPSMTRRAFRASGSRFSNPSSRPATAAIVGRRTRYGTANFRQLSTTISDRVGELAGIELPSELDETGRRRPVGLGREDTLGQTKPDRHVRDEERGRAR